jgi:hypothetical protein
MDEIVSEMERWLHYPEYKGQGNRCQVDLKTLPNKKPVRNPRKKRIQEPTS